MGSATVIYEHSNTLRLRMTSDSNRFKYLLPLMLSLSVLYFSYHLLTGEYGFFSLVQLHSEVTQAQEQLDSLRAERFRIEHRADHMRDNSLDLDLLEEQVRKELGYVNPDEELYIIGSTAGLDQ